MLQKKICMLGSFGVGKTSLVSQFVYSIFSEQYLSTIGVRIDRKSVEIDDDNQLNLLVWDLHGDDEFQRVRASYLRGMAGYLLVVDGTRSESLQVALDLQQLAADTAGDVPFVLLINKFDLQSEWNIDQSRIEELEASGWHVRKTSAKSGRMVNESFEFLAREMYAASASPDDDSDGEE